MVMLATIFFDFNLPTPATWFYMSLLLAVALFFKFSRFLSIRNWDVLTLFLLVPGLLLRQEARSQTPAAGTDASPATTAAAATPEAPRTAPNRILWFAYLWLLCGSGYFLARCLFDLALERRPVLAPNLNLGGLAWLAGALFICLVAVAARRPTDDRYVAGQGSAAIQEALKHAKDAVGENGDASGVDTALVVERSLAILCHLAVAVALVVIGCRHFQNATAGMAMATFYLLLPYTERHIEQVHHVWPTALLLWAIAAYRWPTVAGLLVGLAAGSIYFPALTLPVWLSFYWRRGAGRFLAAFVLAAGLCLAITGLILWADGELAGRIQTALEHSDWQPWKLPTADGFWQGINWPYRIPVFVAYAVFVLATMFWPAPKNLAHLIALLAAILIGFQFWFANEGGVYVLWYVPLLILLVFRPNLSDRQPVPIVRETDWLNRLGRGLGRGVKRLLRVPEPLAQVP